MKSNLQKFRKVPLIISIVFLLAASAVFLLLYREIQNNYQTSKELEITLNNEAENREEMKSLDRSLKALELERLSLDTHFINSSDVVPFLDTVEGLAPTVGARAEVSAVDVSKDGSSLIVETKVSGTYEAIYKFLILLENSPYELGFLSLDIQRSSEITEEDSKNLKPDWSATFKMNISSFIK